MKSGLIDRIKFTSQFIPNGTKVVARMYSYHFDILNNRINFSEDRTVIAEIIFNGVIRHIECMIKTADRPHGLIMNPPKIV